LVEGESSWTIDDQDSPDEPRKDGGFDGIGPEFSFFFERMNSWRSSMDSLGAQNLRQVLLFRLRFFMTSDIMALQRIVPHLVDLLHP
jgi:hypothetical protein